MVELFSKLEDILSCEKIKNCFVDTSVLFSVTYPSDSFNDLTVAAFDCLSDFRISAFTNVNVRSEILEGHHIDSKLKKKNQPRWSSAKLKFSASC